MAAPQPMFLQQLQQSLSAAGQAIPTDAGRAQQNRTQAPLQQFFRASFGDTRKIKIAFEREALGDLVRETVAQKQGKKLNPFVFISAFCSFGVDVLVAAVAGVAAVAAGVGIAAAAEILAVPEHTNHFPVLTAGEVQLIHANLMFWILGGAEEEKVGIPKAKFYRIFWDSVEDCLGQMTAAPLGTAPELEYLSQIKIMLCFDLKERIKSNLSIKRVRDELEIVRELASAKKGKFGGGGGAAAAAGGGGGNFTTNTGKPRVCIGWLEKKCWDRNCQKGVHFCALDTAQYLNKVYSLGISAAGLAVRCKGK